MALGFLAAATAEEEEALSCPASFTEKERETEKDETRKCINVFERPFWGIRCN